VFGLVSRVAPYIAWVILAALGFAVWWVVAGFSLARLAVLGGVLVLIELALKVA
jgi:hypothetical protein